MLPKKAWGELEVFLVIVDRVMKAIILVKTM